MSVDKVRIGFIGAGWWATANHMPLLAARQDVELAAVCRLGREELEQVQSHFGFAYATEDYRELLDRGELDGVIVASPHTMHYEHAKAVLEMGIPVMCEKPMTTRAAEARDLVRLAEEQGVELLVPYGWHHKSFVQRAKAWMDDGLVGEVEYVLCHMASPTRALMSGEAVDMSGASGQSAENLFNPAPSTWSDPQVAGGGYGHGQVSHSTGMMFLLTGLRTKSAYALMTGPGSKVDIYDAIAARFTSGAIGTVSGASDVPEDRGFQVDLRIFGSEGMLLVDCERARLELRRHDGNHRVEDLEADAGGYECNGPPNNFVDLILGQSATNWSSGDVAMRSVELLDAAYRSAASGVEEAV
jgi:predicted dehydrogenase